MGLLMDVPGTSQWPSALTDMSVKGCLLQKREAPSLDVTGSSEDSQWDRGTHRYNLRNSYRNMLSGLYYFKVGLQWNTTEVLNQV
jgi:hypothetical protein